MPGRPDAVERILAFNDDREPERLRLKYGAMASGAFRFLRGSCHLFHEDWPQGSGLNGAPPSWISGDLHLENFGTYKGDDRIIYFDINDFDEAVLAPCTWEVTRLATSVLVAAADNGITRRQASGLAGALLDAYGEALARGKARRVERLVAEGAVRELLDGLLLRTRAELLRQRTERRGGRPRLRLGKRALPATADQRRAVTGLLRDFGRREKAPRFYRVLDVARRVAGTGSLGVPRFVVLVQGKGAPDALYLLDIKAARPSALAPFSPCRQPRWANDGERIVAIQERMQAVAPALLHAVTMGARPFILRELQPSEDRLDLQARHGRIDHFASAMHTMGSVMAWSQLRSAGRQGSATADDFIGFAGRSGWRADVLAYARDYAPRVVADWQAFRRAAEAGRITLPGGPPLLSDED
jgi:uncharacterized protein (DUF2252 family)